MSYFNERAKDPQTLQLRQNCFADLAEHLVVQAVPLAAAQATNLMGETDSVSGEGWGGLLAAAQATSRLGETRLGESRSEGLWNAVH